MTRGWQRVMTAWRFLAARIRRLAPVFWAGTLLCIAATVIRIHYEPVPSNLALFSAMGLLLIPYLAPGIFAYPINPVAWTLLWELIVNFCLCAVAARACEPPKLAALIVVLLSLASYASFHSYRAWSFGMTGSDLWLGGLRALPEFLMGVLVVPRSSGRIVRARAGGLAHPAAGGVAGHGVLASGPFAACRSRHCHFGLPASGRRPGAARKPRAGSPPRERFPIRYMPRTWRWSGWPSTPRFWVSITVPGPCWRPVWWGMAFCIAWVLYRLFDPAARTKPLSQKGISPACEASPSPYKPRHLARAGGFRRVFRRPRPVSLKRDNPRVWPTGKGD